MSAVASFLPRDKVWVECSKEGLMNWSEATEYWWVVAIAIVAVYILFFLFLKKGPRPQEAYEQVDWNWLNTHLRHSLLEVIPFSWSGQRPPDIGFWLEFHNGRATYQRMHTGADVREIIRAKLGPAPTCEITYQNGEAVSLTCTGFEPKTSFSMEQQEVFKNLRDHAERHAELSVDKTPNWKKDEVWPSWSS